MNANNQQPIQIYDMDIDFVHEFTYLGSKMTVDGNVEMGVEKRIRRPQMHLMYLRRHGSRVK